MNPVPGAGRSTPRDFWRVARKTSWSALGNRCGSTRFVIDAMPNFTSGSDARSCWAARFARSMRIWPCRPCRASIERVTSRTTYASASDRTFRSDVRSTSGCAAASPSRTPTATTATSGTTRTLSGRAGTPSASRTPVARFETARNAPSGTRTRSASRAPFGVRNWSETSSTNCTLLVPLPGWPGRGAARLPLPAGRVRCRAALDGLDARAPPQDDLEVVLRLVVCRVGLDRLLEVRERDPLRRGALFLVGGGCREHQHAEEAESPRPSAGVGVAVRDLLQQLLRLRAAQDRVRARVGRLVLLGEPERAHGLAEPEVVVDAEHLVAERRGAERAGLPQTAVPRRGGVCVVT